MITALQPETSHTAGFAAKIYAPHGSFIALHRSYFEKGGTLDYGDLIVVREGYHPFVTAYGHDAYYLNDDQLRRLDAGSGKETSRVHAEGDYTFTSGVATDGKSVYLTGFGGVYRLLRTPDGWFVEGEYD